MNLRSPAAIMEGHGDKVRKAFRHCAQKKRGPLRLALSAAAVCAVLAASTFSGAHRTGLLAIGTVQQAEPILVRTASRIAPLDVEKVGCLHDRLPSPL